MCIEDLALLHIRGLGSRGAYHLIEHFGDAESIYRASLHQLTSDAGLRPDIAEQIVAKVGFREAEEEIKYCRHNAICALAATDDDYPTPLAEAQDRPHVLFVMGNVEALSMSCLSMVGTREASPSGIHVCDKLVEGLSAHISNLCIVSGLAYGIDSACHRAALAHDVPTVAVVASTLPEVTPTPHENLAKEIINKGGAIVSELHSHSKQNGRLFLARNRIIAGLSMGTVVVESPASGGSLATAEIADSYGRTVMAVPGRLTDSNSFGSNNLIRSGKARLILTAEDIIEDLGWTPSSRAKVEEVQDDNIASLSPIQRTIMEAFDNATTLDWGALISATKLSMGELSMVVMDLELKGLIRCLPGQRFERI